MVESKTFELESRTRIYNCILKNPGLHRRGLNRKLNISYTNLKYHLNYLKENEYILEVRKEGYVRYYVPKKINEMNQTIFHLFRQELPRKIILFLSTYPDATLVDIARRWEKDPRTISYHMDKLIKEGFLESIPDGNKKRFRLDNEEKIFDFLVTYEKNDFGETYRTWMKYFNKKNKEGDFLDKAFDVFWDICPHPYHI